MRPRSRPPGASTRGDAARRRSRAARRRPERHARRDRGHASARAGGIRARARHRGAPLGRRGDGARRVRDGQLGGERRPRPRAVRPPVADPGRRGPLARAARVRRPALARGGLVLLGRHGGDPRGLRGGPPAWGPGARRDVRGRARGALHRGRAQRGPGRERLPDAPHGDRPDGRRRARRAGGDRAAAPPAGRRRGVGARARGRRGARRVERAGVRQPAEGPRRAARRPRAGHLGSDRDRGRGGGAMEDRAEREREGARVLLGAPGARPQRGRGMVGRRRRAFPRRRPPARGRAPRRRDPLRPHADRGDRPAEARDGERVTEGLPSPRDGVAEAIAGAIRERSSLEPVAAVVLGSGLGRVLERTGELAGRDDGVEIPYAELPGFPPPTVPGHAGALWLGELDGVPFAAFRGRIHRYEGHPMPLASLTARVAAILGARTIVLTAAAGALDPGLEAGTHVVLSDHVNPSGENPLSGWRTPDGSPAFVDVSQVYDAGLADVALDLAAEDGPAATAGIYVAVPGPAYETPAETEAYRRMGGTVIGMSVVPEAVAAHALGLRVLGLSFVTNAAGASVSHEEVLAVSDRAAEDVGRVLAGLLERLGRAAAEGKDGSG